MQREKENGSKPWGNFKVILQKQEGPPLRFWFTYWDSWFLTRTKWVWKGLFVTQWEFLRERRQASHSGLMAWDDRERSLGFSSVVWGWAGVRVCVQRGCSGLNLPSTPKQGAALLSYPLLQMLAQGEGRGEDAELPEVKATKDGVRILKTVML